MDESEYFKWRDMVKNAFPIEATEPESNERIVFIDMENIKKVNEDIYYSLKFNFAESYKHLKLAFKTTDWHFRFIPDTDYDFSKRNDLKENKKTHLHRIKAMLVSVTPVLARKDSVDYMCLQCNAMMHIPTSKKREFIPRKCKLGHTNIEKMRDNYINYQVIEFVELSDIQKTKNESGELLTGELILSQIQGDYISNRFKGAVIEIVGTMNFTPENQLFIQINNFIPAEEINLKQEDEEKIREVLSNDNYITEICKEIGRNVEGMDELKYLLFLVNIGLEREEEESNQFNVVLFGGWGTGKTVTVRRFPAYMPKCKLVSATGTSYVGLLASLERNNIFNTWEVRAGLMIMYNNGVLILDELDKMDKEAKNALHNPLSDGIISLGKASKADFYVNTNVIAVANPINQKFDPTVPIYGQLGIESTILDRFGLWVILLPRENKEEINKIVSKILQNMSGQKYNNNIESFSKEFVKKIIFYLKKIPNPIIREDVQKYIFDKIMLVMDTYQSHFNDNPRFPASLVKLSRIHARAFGKSEVTEKDVDMALILFQKLMFNPLYKMMGKLNTVEYVNLIKNANEIKIPTSPSKKMEWIRNAIFKRINEENQQTITFDELLKIGTDVGISEQELEKIIKHMNGMGDLIENRANSGVYTINR